MEYVDYLVVYDRAEKLINLYSGRGKFVKAIIAEGRVEEVWAGEPGNEYRRLLKELWANGWSGEDCGGGKFTPFKKLFAFERARERARKEARLGLWEW